MRPLTIPSRFFRLLLFAARIATNYFFIFSALSATVDVCVILLLGGYARKKGEPRDQVPLPSLVLRRVKGTDTHHVISTWEISRWQ